MKYSACINRGDLLRLGDTVRMLEEQGWSELYFPVMDGRMAPRFTLGEAFVRAVKECTGLPCAVHLLTERPEEHVDQFVAAGADMIIVPVETCNHAQRTLARIRDAGASPAIALNPTTPLIKVDYLLDYSDRVVILAEETGHEPRHPVPGAEERAALLKQNIEYRNLKTEIAVFGDLDARGAAMVEASGAELLVVDTPGLHLREGIASFKKEVQAKMVALQAELT